MIPGTTGMRPWELRKSNYRAVLGQDPDPGPRMLGPNSLGSLLSLLANTAFLLWNLMRLPHGNGSDGSTVNDSNC